MSFILDAMKPFSVDLILGGVACVLPTLVALMLPLGPVSRSLSSTTNSLIVGVTPVCVYFFAQGYLYLCDVISVRVALAIHKWIGNGTDEAAKSSNSSGSSSSSSSKSSSSSSGSNNSSSSSSRGGKGGGGGDSDSSSDTTAGIASVVRAVLILIGLRFVLSFETVTTGFSTLFDMFVGDFPELLVATYGPQWTQQWGVFQRTTTVFLFATAVFFILESVVGVALRFFGAAARGIMGAGVGEASRVRGEEKTH